ncbi:MAG: cation transporter [Acidobacteria bacterium]|nr:MAG: cation transporter [Acidobacteriota bacterium]REJ98426.1 MAG: cation transporter [Acidobacteriota bacterium]REK17171.1 MAG: cation transporter [Acidobacteriota bacterium]REK43082.1 MAG: cation transporter [Acidobacteriota bacterium]
MPTQAGEHQGSFHGLEANARVLKITGWLTGVYFVIELALGFYSGSVAVISDAFHTFSAVGGILIAVIANRISARAADKHATFGYKRAEIVGALLNGLFLLLMAFYVLYMGYMRLFEDLDLPAGIMMLAAGGGLVTEFIAFGLIYKRQKGNLNMQGAFWHVMQTFVGSVLIIVAALVIYFTGWTRIDPILGMAFGVVLVYASYGIIKDAINILMQAVPKDLDVNEIRKDLAGIDGVVDVRHPHAWVLTSEKNIFSAHVQIDRREMSQAVLDKATKLLKDKYGFFFSTIQIEEEHIDTGSDAEMYKA